MTGKEILNKLYQLEAWAEGLRAEISMLRIALEKSTSKRPSATKTKYAHSIAKVLANRNKTLLKPGGGGPKKKGPGNKD